MLRLGRIAVERIEYDGVRAEQPQLVEVVDDLLDRALAGEAFGIGDRRVGEPEGDARYELRHRPPLLVRDAAIRATPSRSHGTVFRSGCHASPRRTARRFPASLLPPTQIGIRPLR